MLIKNCYEREKVRQEKIINTLNFLKQETYSDNKTIQRVLKLNGRRPVDRLLTKMIGLGLIKKHEFDLPVGKLSIWGITTDGLAESYNDDDSLLPRFEPSKLKLWTLQHHLDNQNVRLTLEEKGCTDWIHGDRKNFMAQFDVKHRPDGIITLPRGKRIAIETERNLKTKVRYQKIIQSHLNARMTNKWAYVFYVLPNENKKRTLMKIFSEIKHVTIDGRLVILDASHRDSFQFFTLDELREFQIKGKDIIQ